MMSAGVAYLRARAHRLNGEGVDALARRTVRPRFGVGLRTPTEELVSEELCYQAGRGRPELGPAARLERVATGPTRCDDAACGECGACWLAEGPVTLP